MVHFWGYFVAPFTAVFGIKIMSVRTQGSSNFRMCAQTPGKTGGKNSGDCFTTDKEQSTGLEGDCM